MAELSAKEKKILWYIYSTKHVPRKSLLELSHYKAPTLYRVIETLVQNDFVRVSGCEDMGSKGRPNDLLSANPSVAYVFSICILRESFCCAVVDFGNEIRAMKRHALVPGMKPEELTEALYRDFEQMSGELELTRERFLGVGLSAVGPLNYQNGLMLGPLYFLAGEWKNIPIVQMIESKFGMEVHMDCNAGAALLGNYIPKYFERHENVVYVTIGNCIGSGLVINRRLMENRNIILDGFAHMTIDMDGRKCSCGEYGCVEAYVSIPAILDQCAREMRLGAASCMRDRMDCLTLEDISLGVRHKDALAMMQIRRAANILAKCIVNYLRMVKLDAVILGGGLIEAIPEFYEQVEEFAREKNHTVTFYRATEKEKNILRGIASEIIERYVLGE